MIKECLYCKKQFETISIRQKYCGKNCCQLAWSKTDKGKAQHKKVYEKAKMLGRANYQTAKGVEQNRLRSKKYRLLNTEKVKEYKRLKGIEYRKKKRELNGGNSYLTPEETKLRRIKYDRLNQRLSRQSISGKLQTQSGLDERDISALELDVQQLQERKTKLQLILNQGENENEQAYK